jgi:hypothetical protein
MATFSFRPIVVAAILLSLVTAQGADAKKFTIYERQVKLNQEIDAGQKSGDLTLKEATKLRDEASGISECIEKCKEKNAGKISIPDQNKIEKQLNKLSLNIQKKKLQKRVQ